MPEHRVVVYDTIKIKAPKPKDPRIWGGLILLGSFLFVQTWASLEFQAVIKAPYVNLPYTVLICLLFFLTWLAEIAAVLVIVFLILAGVFLAGQAVFRFLSRIYQLVFRR
ncbi:MAG TPA: hypothetical protein VN112_03865 [Ensifer sp.]|nr:hypothetical protein [Ensifer sp.]